MNEPRRWLDDPATARHLEEVLEAAPSAPSMPTALHDELGAYAANLLAQGAVVSGAHTVLGTKVTAWLWGSAWSKALVVTAAVGAAGSVGYVAVDRELTSPATPGASTSRADARAAQERAIPAPAAPRAALPVAGAASANTLPSRAQASFDASGAKLTNAEVPALANDSESKAASPSRGVAAFEPPSIADEAKLLELARTALERDPNAALELAEQHRRLHPDGQLSAERELIAIDALVRLGRREEAQRRAAPRLGGAPESLYSRRLRQLLTD